MESMRPSFSCTRLHGSNKAMQKGLTTLLTTYSYRIKDSNTKKTFSRMARDVNFVWNFSNDVIRRRWKESRKYTSKYDFNPLIKGASKELSINSQTIQAVAHECAMRTQKAKKNIKFRGKKSLGWIPFIGQTFQFHGPTFTYNRKTFRIWCHRDLPADAKIKVGSICQNSLGQWFLNVTFETAKTFAEAPNREVAIDLGLKTVATSSDGKKFSRENLTKSFEERLARQQRARKPKQAKKTHLKIKNKRKDFAHKVSAEIASENKTIFVGDVSSGKLIKTRFAKSTHDAGWYQLKQFLKYKALRHSGKLIEISEKYSTVTCSTCFEKSGPSGLSALGVREWECKVCFSVHDRDVNAALIILRFGREALLEESVSSKTA